MRHSILISSPSQSVPEIVSLPFRPRGIPLFILSPRTSVRSLGLPSGRNFSSSPRSGSSPHRQPKLPDTPARTRFAPSPTGHLHIGGLRTALFSYLLAKRTGGQFLLRIEDTDQKRLVRGAEQRLCEDLQWAGLQWDEGPGVGGPHGPYKQSERLPIYHDHTVHLLDDGLAYRCFCTPQATDQGKTAYVTSGCYQNCSSLSPSESRVRAESDGGSFTVRLHPPLDAPKRVYPDLVYGKIQRLKRSPAAPQVASEDETGVDAADTILVKSDGTPTYHFANVIDDHLMKVTHVIRGLEWMASTPLHYDIYQAFGWQPPQFAHVGLLVDHNKAKLSKRNTDLALDVRSMREEQGVLPETLNNFLALLGWSNPTSNDVMDMSALIDHFDLKFTKGNTMVKTEKLWYLQKQHVARLCNQVLEGNGKSKSLVDPIVGQMVAEVHKTFGEISINGEFTSRSRMEAPTLEAYCINVLLADHKSYQNANQFVNRNRYFFSFDPQETPGLSHSYSNSHSLGSQPLQDIMEALLRQRDWSRPYHQPHASIDNDSHTALRDDSISSGGDDMSCSARQIERLSSLIHAAINNEIWQVVTDPHNKFLIDIPINWQLPEGSQQIDLPFTPQSVPALDFAQQCEQRQIINSLEAQELVKRYKLLNSGVMKYLREKLCHSLPGPSISMIMAVLGYRECCRRLGVTPQSDEGWNISLNRR